MRWLKLIELISLILLGAVALMILLPLIVLSLQILVVTSFLLAVGAFGVWLWAGVAHLHTWFEKHHWMTPKGSGPRLRVS